MGKVTQEFGEVLADQAGTGRLSEVVGEVFFTPSTSARLSTVMGEVFWSFLLPVANVPDIRGIARLLTTFDSSASTGGYGDGSTLTTRFWSWTAVPSGSAIANITPTPLPNSGGSSFISMANNAVLYHCEGNGTDSSGNLNTATFTSITTAAAGKVGSFAWSFDAENARASLTSAIALGSSWTIMFWFYDLDGDGTWREAIQDAGGGTIHISVNPSNLLGVYVGGHTSSGYTMNAAYFTGWHHMVAVGSGTTTTFYVDGVFVGTAAVKPTANVQYIGTTFSERFAARMDEIAIFTSRAFSQSEVEATYVNQQGSYAGTGTTFPFTPDKAGTYTIQFALSDGLRPGGFPLTLTNANAEVVNADSSIWPSERLTVPAIQGRCLHTRRGQM